MKVRQGFVSNSSSSSFICDVCGENASGYDMGLADAQMYDCDNSHTVCEDHIYPFMLKVCTEKSIEEITASMSDWQKEALTDAYDEWHADQGSVPSGQDLIDIMDEVFEDMRYELPSIFCPVCQLKDITKSDMVKYLLHERHKTYAELENEIAERFKSNPQDFYTHISGN